MSEPFLAEIRMVGFNFAPRGWAFCDGQILPINQNQALFSLLGTTYGGDGRVTFALPDLRGRVPIHVASSHRIGERGGQETVTLTLAQIPAHVHPLAASENEGTSSDPSGRVLAHSRDDLYHAPTDLVPMHAAAGGAAGGGQPHENRQPYMALSFCIALQGLFPSRN
ncbi:MAG: phage tail protein [Myxococcales bacterium]|nr:phage tail protein [Myxococcales bacterium]MCA9578478.1 phage tail protein [Myxococcales bacterium]MCB9630426.1 phage tail protein [Sandaracinaceae bacterium]